MQGLPLPHLRYRWAAMNPCSSDQAPGEDYAGSEPLDPALADRFALIVEVGDWDELNEDERRRVADPAGEGAAADDGGCLKAELAAWQRRFAARLQACPAPIVDYVCAVTTALGNAGVRLSPRRARLLTRTLLAVLVVEGLDSAGPGGRTAKALFRVVLDASLPQRAWGDRPDAGKVLAAHELAWSGTMLKGRDQWLHLFHLEAALDRKARLLVDGCPDPDTGTVAVEQLLANESKERAAAFALAAFPAAAAGRLPIGAEGVNDLGRAAGPLLSVKGEVRWQERVAEKGTAHPELTVYARILSGLGDERRQRAQQLFYYCAINGIGIREPREFEQEFDRTVTVFSQAGRA